MENSAYSSLPAANFNTQADNLKRWVHAIFREWEKPNQRVNPYYGQDWRTSFFQTTWKITPFQLQSFSAMCRWTNCTKLLIVIWMALPTVISAQRGSWQVHEHIEWANSTQGKSLSVSIELLIPSLYYDVPHKMGPYQNMKSRLTVKTEQDNYGWMGKYIFGTSTVHSSLERAHSYQAITEHKSWI